ncbi:hypothetical protein JCM3774_006604 [Rhodotorula dairenensis]
MHGSRGEPTSLSLSSLTAPPTSSGTSEGPHATGGETARSPPAKMRKSPPKLDLNGVVPNRSQLPAAATRDETQPYLVVQPASPAPDVLAATAAPLSSAISTTPFPAPIPSTSTAGQPLQPPYAGSFLPPPSPQAQGGGLAARRAAKLGKKRLSLLVPANPHSSVPVAGPLSASLAGPGPAANQTLLSPLTPSFLLPGSLKSPANGMTSTSTAAYDAETRSLPPSPLSLTTFIGPEGSEAPDRTIGRLMLKQQADEMREQMRGKRGMKRRTSIPRLNLVKTGVAQAQPANLDAIASQAAASCSAASTSPSASFPGLGSRSTSGQSSSAVQFLRSAENGGARSSFGGDGADGPVEEFPYALGPREILPGIFLGSEQNAKDAAVLRDWRIRFVLNVAKEVECPWIDEAQVLAAQDAFDRLNLHGAGGAKTPAAATVTDDSPPRIRTPTARRSTPPPPLRRSQSHAPDAPIIMAESPAPAAPGHLPSSDPIDAPAPPMPDSARPTFIRPTASTPNLHASFDLPASPPPPVPPMPDLRDLSAVYPALGTSPEAEPLEMPAPAKRDRAARSSRHSGTGPSPSHLAAGRSTDTLRIPSNPGSGRPELDYLWLKWGHDESDLVEAKKFQAAFDFLDEARERDERVLVHCQCGVSRSATVVIAYCMREAAKALEEGREATELAGCTGMHDTYSFVKEKSEWVGPNLSLVFQLVAYERTLRGDSINGDDDLSEPPSAAFRSETPRTQSDLPPATPLDVERPFAFPRPPVRPISRMVNGTLASPHTPVSDASLAYSQMSTPELRDPLLSPTLSSATKSSSVTSTPLSPERQYQHRPAVRIVHSDSDETSQPHGRHEPLGPAGLATEHARKGPDDRVESVFVLPVPPHDVPGFSSATDVISPTLASYPASTPHGEIGYVVGGSTTSADRQGLCPSAPALSLDPSALSHSARPGLPILAPISASPLSTSPPALPTLQVITEHLPSPFSPSGSNSSLDRTPSSTSSSQLPSSESLLVRSHSGRRFGAGQTLSERRASHRRVCSDTIRIPTPLGFTSATSPAGTTPRAGTPEVEAGPHAPL